jgi:meiotically up-regulated gene 157 (Mug157) protein
MSWSGFRPSDDATKYGYNIPGNMYAVAALERAVQLNADVWQDADFERAASHLIAAMRCVPSQVDVKANRSGRLLVLRSDSILRRGVSVLYNPRLCCVDR